MLLKEDENLLQKTLKALCIYFEKCKRGYQFALYYGGKELVVNLIRMLTTESSRKKLRENTISIALRTVADLSLGTSQPSGIMFKEGICEVMSVLLQSKVPAIEKDAAFALANIVAGRKNEVRLVREAGLHFILLTRMMSTNASVLIEATIALTNMVIAG